MGTPLHKEVALPGLPSTPWTYAERIFVDADLRCMGMEFSFMGLVAYRVIAARRAKSLLADIGVAPI